LSILQALPFEKGEVGRGSNNSPYPCFEKRGEVGKYLAKVTENSKFSVTLIRFSPGRE